MTKKDIVDKIWEFVADQKEQALKDWDHFANIGDYLDAKTYKGEYQAFNRVRDFLYKLYQNNDLYR